MSPDGGWESDGKLRSAFSLAFDSDATLMLFDDCVADTQTQSRPSLLGREKWLKEFMAMFLKDACPIVDDIDFNYAFGRHEPGFNSNDPFLRN